MLRAACLLALLAAVAHGIPIDNGVEGDPEIVCGSASIGIKASTRNPFSGHVYVKNRFAEVRFSILCLFDS